MNWLWKILGWKICGLCKSEFKNKKPDQVWTKDSFTGDYDKIDICVHCASVLEVTKMKEKNEGFYSVDNS